VLLKSMIQLSLDEIFNEIYNNSCISITRKAHTSSEQNEKLFQSIANMY